MHRTIPSELYTEKIVGQKTFECKCRVDLHLVLHDVYHITCLSPSCIDLHTSALYSTRKGDKRHEHHIK